MKKNNNIPQENKSKPNRYNSGLDPVMIFKLIKKNWYIFALALLAAFVLSRLYIANTLPVYRTSSTVLINETGERPIMENEELLQGLGLPSGMRNLDNQIMILQSRTLTEKALSELPFETEYYYKTFRNNIPVYPDIPVKVMSTSELPLPKNTEFSIKPLPDNKFLLESESDYYPLRRKASYGELIEVPGGKFRIELLRNEWFDDHKNDKLFFTIHSKKKMIQDFNNRIDVELLSRSGSIVKVSIRGTNKARDVEFLNKLTEVFQSISLDKKNNEAYRRIEFIDQQLVGISDSLTLTENKLQQFRSANRIMDVSAQGEAIIGQLTLLENEKARLDLEANYYDYLADYLDSETGDEAPIIPITMGINDPALTRLVTELGDLQAQMSGQNAREMNPLQNRLKQRIENTKAALLETLNGLSRANTLAKEENANQIRKLNAEAAALPVTQRRLLGIERKFRLNDELYTFLLETRAEQEMQKASNTADSEVVDPASELFSEVIAPDPAKVYFAGLFAGFGIPFLLIFLNFAFRKKLREEDIRMITNLPIVGNIPRSKEKTNKVVLDHPFSSIAESYRLLRSRMQFFAPETKQPVILITSAMPEDGKTFTSINLASVYSLLGMNTVLVEFDLRKPKLSQEFKINNEKGVSTWLIGLDRFENIIQKTSYKNLSVISSGPVPLNPSEITASKKTDEFIKLLKEKFDYIIIDTSPIGLISETYHLASLADICLLVVRSGKTLRNMFESTLNDINRKFIKSLGVIINDIPPEKKEYHYGNRYGYTSDKKQPVNQNEKEKLVK